MTSEPLSDSAEVEVRYCPLGPPHKRDGKITYAWCPECERVRKSTLDCPLVKASADDE